MGSHRVPVALTLVLLVLNAGASALHDPLGAQGQPVWNLSKVSIYFNPPPANNIYVTGLTADGNGGEALVTMDGRTLDLCPGGVEKLLVKWRFDRSVAQLTPGERFTIAMSAVPVVSGPPCDGRLLGRTYVNVAHADGHTADFLTPAERSTMYGATYSIGGARMGHPDWGGSAVVGVRDQVPSPLDGAGRPDPRTNTWFSIWVQYPSTSAEIVYMYGLGRVGVPLPPPSWAPEPPSGGPAATLRGDSGGTIGCVACDGRFRALLPGASGTRSVSDRNDPSTADGATPFSRAGVLRGLRVETSAADGGVWYFMLGRPGKPGGLSCSLDGRQNPGVTACEDRSGSMNVDAGDRVVLIVGNPGSPVTPGAFRVNWSVEFTPR